MSYPRLRPASLAASLLAVIDFGLAAGQGLKEARNGGLDWAAALNWLTLGYMLSLLRFVRGKIGQDSEQSSWYTFTYPVGLIVVGGIAHGSLLRTALGLSSEWKGRRYQS